jgi:hypothetical protein
MGMIVPSEHYRDNAAIGANDFPGLILYLRTHVTASGRRTTGPGATSPALSRMSIRHSDYGTRFQVTIMAWSSCVVL